MASRAHPAPGGVASAVQCWAPRLAALAALAALLRHFLYQLQSAIVAIRFPFGMDYGEGIVWQQMRNIMRGVGYGPLGVYPAIVYHYPPVFHLTTGLIATIFGTDALATGRAISWIATLGCAAIIGAMTALIGRGRGRLVNSLCALFAGLIFLSIEPVGEWAVLMRVDMLAYLFSLAGLAIAIVGVNRPRLIPAAALCFTLAIYTKQVSIAAPAAAFVGLLVVRPRLAWGLALYGMLGGLVLLLLMMWLTDGRFLRHIILYNVNRIQPEMIRALLPPIGSHLPYVALSIAGAFMLVRRTCLLWTTRESHAAEVAAAVAALAYFVLKTLMLGMIVKSGANVNYMVEWFCAVALLAGVALSPILTVVMHAPRGDAATQPPSALLATAILLIVGVQAHPFSVHALTMAGGRSEAATLEPIVALIRATRRPVISDDMTLLLRAGREVEWEPAIAAELGAAGRYDEAGLVRMIRQRRFGLFITEGDSGDPSFDSRYNPAVAAAIASAYPRRWTMQRFTIHAPARR